ncbi:MAG: cytochrome c3 family protein [Thermincolia bacterium]
MIQIKITRPVTIALGVAVLLLIGFKPLVTYTESPEFCGSCHGMKKAYATWQQSAHRQVKCVSCHAGEGLSGFIQAKVRGGTQALKQFTTAPQPGKKVLRAHVETEKCLNCHQAITRFNEVGVRDLTDELIRVGLVVAHDVHRKNEIACLTCHSGIVHSGQINPRPKEKTCFGCHNGKLHQGKIVSKDCSTCHRGMITQEDIRARERGV